MSESRLVKGETRVKNGDLVKLRLLRYEEGTVSVDRPKREVPLELNFPEETPSLSLEETGTYELTGTVRKAIYGENKNLDYFFLGSDWHIEQIAESSETIDLPDPGPESVSPGRDTEVEGVDIDFESLYSDE
jgi:hypothetical protein